MRRLLPSVTAVVLRIANSARTHVNVMYRIPTRGCIPSTDAAGDPVDAEAVQGELVGLIDTLRQTNLTDQVHRLPELGYYEASRVGELIVAMNSVLYPMPLTGMEFRRTESADLIRFLTSRGCSGEFHGLLRDFPGACATGGDFVVTPQGLIMGYGDGRKTNKLALQALEAMTHSKGDDEKPVLPVVGVPLPEEAPALGDMLAFAGSRTLIAAENAHALKAAEAVVKGMGNIPWQVLRVENDCDVLSFYGALPTTDVVVAEGFDKSIDSLGDGGLNPFPVPWRAARGVRLSMRSFALVVPFSFGHFSGGGFAQQAGRVASERNFHKPRPATALGSGQRRCGDQGAPLEAQLRSLEFPELVFQPPPRYAPPMKRKGGLRRVETPLEGSTA